MAVKRIITALEYAAISAALKPEYKADATGESYVLDLSDYEDPATLKRAKDHEKEARKTAEKAAKDLQDRLETLTEERDGILRGAIPKADVEKLESSYKAKFTARETELNTQLAALRGNLNTMLVDNVANSLASELSTVPAVILPHIRARLAAEYADGKATTRVLDLEGKPSALTVEDLKKEFIANKNFAPILVASKGSGGGAAGSGHGGGAASKKLSEMSATEEARFANEHPQEYAKLVSG